MTFHMTTKILVALPQNFAVSAVAFSARLINQQPINLFSPANFHTATAAVRLIGCVKAES